MRKGAPPVMMKTYVQTRAENVKGICGEEISGPTELMVWMAEHEDELGYELPKSFHKELEKWLERQEKRERSKK